VLCLQGLSVPGDLHSVAFEQQIFQPQPGYGLREIQSYLVSSDRSYRWRRLRALQHRGGFIKCNSPQWSLIVGGYPCPTIVNHFLRVKIIIAFPACQRIGDVIRAPGAIDSDQCGHTHPATWAKDTDKGTGRGLAFEVQIPCERSATSIIDWFANATDI